MPERYSQGTVDYCGKRVVCDQNGIGNCPVLPDVLLIHLVMTGFNRDGNMFSCNRENTNTCPMSHIFGQVLDALGNAGFDKLIS